MRPQTIDPSPRTGTRGFVGRENELASMATLLEADGPRVMHVYGIAGIGKSRLLEVFAGRARTAGATLVKLDCRTMEPTPGGFSRELAEAIGDPAESLETIVPRLGELGSRVLLVLDTCEVYRLMDTWLRQVLVPALPDNVALLCLGRERPVAAWRALPGWQQQFHGMALGPLDDGQAARLLRQLGVPAKAADRIARATHGHPLALQLAAAAHAERPDLAFEEVSLQQALEELTRMFLADVKDPTARRTLEACAVTRRVTVSLLGAMLPDLAPRDAYDRVRTLPFMEQADDGLLIHDAVREAIGRSLRASDPRGFLAYQKAAWQQLLAETREAGRVELWRYTADMLYLIENPVVREAFFPTGTHSLAVEPATAGDDRAIREIIQAHESPAAAEHLVQWWRRRPDTFAVVRETDDSVSGLCCKFISQQAESSWLQEDPVTRQWQAHLRKHPLGDDEQALFCRRWLGAEQGEAPSAVQAALWLDLKRSYLELRPALRRVYLTVKDLDAYAAVASRLGFEVMTDQAVSLDDAVFHSAVLDFGPASVNGWLARLAAEELGIERQPLLDREARALVVDGRWVDITPLEFGVMGYLTDHRGKAVSRADLLKHVWDTRYFGGSNVVDTVIRSLRRKLGPRASQIETVTGVGYRLKSPPPGRY